MALEIIDGKLRKIESDSESKVRASEPPKPRIPYGLSLNDPCYLTDPNEGDLNDYLNNYAKCVALNTLCNRANDIKFLKKRLAGDIRAENICQLLNSLSLWRYRQLASCLRDYAKFRAAKGDYGLLGIISADPDLGKLQYSRRRK